MNRFARLLLPLLLLAATPSEAQNLRIGMPGQPSTLDPHWLLNLNNTSAMRKLISLRTQLAGPMHLRYLEAIQIRRPEVRENDEQV